MQLNLHLTIKKNKIMTPVTFPFVPNQSEIYDTFQNCGTYEIIKSLENLRVHVSSPSKPKPPKEYTSGAMRKYADDLEASEIAFEEYNIQNGKCKIHNLKVESLILDFIKNEAGLNDIPEQYRNKVFSKAWSDGHSCGYYEVYQELCELVELFQ